MMKYCIVPFENKKTDEAINLFRAAYQLEKKSNVLLPDRALHDKAWIKQAMLQTNCNSGVAALSGDNLVGYMLANFQFDFKGQQAVIIREYSHASISKDKEIIYQLMYGSLGEQLISRGINLHIIWHFAHDDVLKDTLFQLGFGAFIAGQLRDLSPIESAKITHIVEETDFMSVANLHLEQSEYYLDSPIFVRKNTNLKSIKEDLAKHAEQGHTLLVYYEKKTPLAYFILGARDESGEGFLIQDSGTAQIMSAYAQPCARGKGIGKTLLAKSVDRAREQGFLRLFVSHETANIYGGNFWRKHFKPFLYCSMRYIDNGVSETKGKK
jgi:GNAT superfamily N-acetyltransferase